MPRHTKTERAKKRAFHEVHKNEPKVVAKTRRKKGAAAKRGLLRPDTPQRVGRTITPPAAVYFTFLPAGASVAIPMNFFVSSGVTASKSRSHS